VHPQAEQESIFFKKIGEIWTVEVDNLVVLACVLRATIKKGRQLFWGGGEKCTPRENPGYSYDRACPGLSCLRYNGNIILGFRSPPIVTHGPSLQGAYNKALYKFIRLLYFFYYL